MEYVVEHSPSFSILKVRLEPRESITVEPGSYILHKGDVEVSTTSGGVLSGIARALFGGETFFLNTFRARSPSEVWIAPHVPGDIVAVNMSGGSIYIQDYCYLAHTGDIKLSVGWRGFKGLVAQGELVWLKAEGTGTVFLNSYGAIEELKLGFGESVTVDNGHFVALDGSIKWNVKLLGGLKTAFFGGEGVVVEVSGPGRVWIQSRSLPPLAHLLSKFMGRQ
ncbi:MAG: TIGR00266 family protein [Acidilobaceae archaeon]